MQVALGHAGEEILKALSRFRRRGDDELPIRHSEVYLGLVGQIGFDGKRLGDPYCQAMPPPLDLGTHGDASGVSFFSMNLQRRYLKSLLPSSLIVGLLPLETARDPTVPSSHGPGRTTPERRER